MQNCTLNKKSKTKLKKKHQRCMTIWPVYRPELASMLKWGNGKARIQGNWVVRQSIIVEKNTPGLVLFQFPTHFENGVKCPDCSPLAESIRHLVASDQCQCLASHNLTRPRVAIIAAFFKFSLNIYNSCIIGVSMGYFIRIDQSNLTWI